MSVIYDVAVIGGSLGGGLLRPPLSFSLGSCLLHFLKFQVHIIDKDYICIVKFISSFLNSFGNMIGKQFTLNKDKYSILSARNWDCDIEDLKKDLNYAPKYDLKRGIEETIKWYKNEKWL